MRRKPPGGFLLFRPGDAERLVDGRLMQDQGMIGDDQIGLARRADCPFDEASPVMRTGGIDAFAAPVGKSERGRGRPAAFAVAPDVAEERQKPGREIASDHVAVAGDGAPSGR